MIELTNIHPMLVHFPIALLILGFLAEVAGLVLKRQFFTDAALLLLVTGALGAVAAFRTALFFAKKYTGSLRYVALFLFLVAVLAVARAGYYGGELVFKHAAGVTFQIG